jgi:D-alanine-D-alanine ligase
VSGPPLTVAVLQGGLSAEREISLVTGGAVAQGLRDAGHRVQAVDVVDPLAVLDEPAVRRCDVVFVALHGGFGEDGRIQALLDLAGRPYVGSGPGACALTMDKHLSKLLFRALEVDTAEWVLLEGDEDAATLRRRRKELGGEVVLKRNDEGSAIDVHLRPDDAALRRIWEDRARRPGRWLLERYIPGRELTLPVVAGTPTPVIEIRPKEGFYDYRNKYTPGRTEYLCPADLPAGTAEAVVAAGERLWRNLDLRDMARIDFRLDPGGRLCCLEVNTIPGMTGTSLLPMGAARLGLSFPDLCDRLCRGALRRAGGQPGGPS